MENEQVTVTLTVAQWQTVLDVVGHAPYIIVLAGGPVLDELRAQAGAQIAELQQKYAADAPTQTEEATQN